MTTIGTTVSVTFKERRSARALGTVSPQQRSHMITYASDVEAAWRSKHLHKNTTNDN